MLAGEEEDEQVTLLIYAYYIYGTTGTRMQKFYDESLRGFFTTAWKSKLIGKKHGKTAASFPNTKSRMNRKAQLKQI